MEMESPMQPFWEVGPRKTRSQGLYLPKCSVIFWSELVIMRVGNYKSEFGPTLPSCSSLLLSLAFSPWHDTEQTPSADTGVMFLTSQPPEL